MKAADTILLYIAGLWVAREILGSWPFAITIISVFLALSLLEGWLWRVLGVGDKKDDTVIEIVTS